MNKILLAVSGGQRFASHIDFARAHDSHGDEYSPPPPPPPPAGGQREVGGAGQALRASVSRLTADFGGR
jgi:hypothetical protein